MEMDVADLTRMFNNICNDSHDDGDAMYRFLLYLIPQYEATKKQLVAAALDQGARELIDWIWEDPLDPTPYNRLNTLKKIAEELKISIKDGRTN